MYGLKLAGRGYMKTFQIDSDKVYTSNYALARKEIPSKYLVGVSITVPDDFSNIHRIHELEPLQSTFIRWKSGSISIKQYTEEFRSGVLSKLNPKEVYEQTKGKVLLCYEARSKFCHRKLITDWLKENLGEEVVGVEL